MDLNFYKSYRINWYDKTLILCTFYINISGVTLEYYKSGLFGIFIFFWIILIRRSVIGILLDILLILIIIYHEYRNTENIWKCTGVYTAWNIRIMNTRYWSLILILILINRMGWWREKEKEKKIKIYIDWWRMRSMGWGE